MKIKIYKSVTIIALFMGWLSCTGDLNDPQEYRFQWDAKWQQEKFRPLNAGTKSSSFTIDNNIISFAVPYLVGTVVNEHPPRPGWGSPEGLSPHFWTISLLL